jgi:hypothetical protein
VSFSLERALALNQVNSTFTATYPPGLMDSVNNKVMEIRESITFDSTNQLLTLNEFSVQSGAPLPTATILPSSIFNILSIKVDKIYTSCTPNTNVMFVGSVATNTPSSPYGNVSGAPAAVSIALSSTTSSTTPPNITNVVVLVGGTVVEYSAAGGGSVTFTQSSVTPPGSTGGPMIVVAPVGPTTYPIVDLDASASTTNNPPLTFQWSVVAGAADVGNATSAKATGYIRGGAGIYTFQVTVTDAKGTVNTQTVNVQFF